MKFDASDLRRKGRSRNDMRMNGKSEGGMTRAQDQTGRRRRDGKEKNEAEKKDVPKRVQRELTA